MTAPSSGLARIGRARSQSGSLQDLGSDRSRDWPGRVPSGGRLPVKVSDRSADHSY